MRAAVQEFGIFIKQRRLEQGLTQEEVAKRLGISQVAYGRYELGQRDPGLDLIYQIADVLGFSVPEFFAGYMEDRMKRYALYQGDRNNGNKIPDKE